MNNNTDNIIQIVLKENGKLLSDNVFIQNDELDGKSTLCLFVRSSNIIANKLYNDELLNFYNDSTKVVINFNTHDISEYKKIGRLLNNNKDLTNKKIVLNYVPLNDEHYNAICNNIKCFEQLYIHLNEDLNGTDISFLNYKRVLDYFNKNIEHILKLGLSPLEKLMYVYDIVRERIYRFKKDSDYSESRNLSSVVLGEEIVCVGFANIFHQFLEMLNIKCKEVNLLSVKRKIGHVRNMVYIDDPKYKINGIYYFDLTWDSRKNEADTKYLNSYLYFARTASEFQTLSISNSKKYETDSTITIEKLNELQNDINKIISADSKVFVTVEFLNIVSTINKISRSFEDREIINCMNYLSGKLTVNTLIKIKLKLEKYKILINNPIRIEEFTKLVYNVRKLQYYENSTKYPFGLSSIRETIIKSKRNLSNNIESKANASLLPVEKLLVFILGEEEFVKKDGDHILFNRRMIEQSIKEYDIDKKINQVKLVKTLQKKLIKDTN